jgi:hypothetical protein
MKTWIKLRSNLETVAEFQLMRRLLNIDGALLVGYLYRWWNYCDQNSRRGELPRPLTLADIDAFTTGGFGEALLKVGWLREERRKLRIPNFHRHFIVSSKARENAGATQARPSRAPRGSGAAARRGSNGRFVKASGEQGTAPQCTLSLAPADEPAAAVNPAVNSTVNSTVNGAAGTVNGTVNGRVTVPLKKQQLVENTVVSRTREEKTREEKKGGDSDFWTAGRGDGGTPPPISFLEFSEAARAAGYPEERWQATYADLASRAFTDRAGKPIQSLHAYLRRCAPASDAPAREARAFTRQPWQVEADLRRIEARLKAEVDGYKPDKEFIRVLRAERTRLKGELAKVLTEAAHLPIESLPNN